MRLQIQYDHDISINAFEWTPRTDLAQRHVHASLEIGYCLSGTGRFYFGNKCYPVGPGDIFIVNNRELHIAQSDETDPSRYIFLNFDPNLLLAEDEHLLLPFCYQPEDFQNRIPGSDPISKQLAPFIIGLWQELQGKQTGYRSMAKSLLLQICASLMRHMSERISRLEWSRMQNSFSEIRDVITYTDNNFREPLELTHIAKMFHMSPSKASRFFKEALGRSFKDYLLSLRLNEAKRLLIQSEADITEICFQSGFQSIASFYRTFHDKVGMSPLMYRKDFYASAIFENQ